MFADILGLVFAMAIALSGIVFFIEKKKPEKASKKPVPNKKKFNSFEIFAASTAILQGRFEQEPIVRVPKRTLNQNTQVLAAKGNMK